MRRATRWQSILRGRGRAAALPRHETAALSAFNELRCGILGVDDEREAGDVVDGGDVV